RPKHRAIRPDCESQKGGRAQSDCFRPCLASPQCRRRARHCATTRTRCATGSSSRQPDMAHVEDRWYTTVKLPEGGRKRVKSERYGTGLRYRVRYVAPDGRERSRSYPDRAKREAEAFLVSVESDKLRGTYVDPAAGRVKFGPYATEWIRNRSFAEPTRE